MTTNHNQSQNWKDIMEQLKAPFHSEEIEWRVQRTVKTRNGWKAIVLCYVTNRAIQVRLDEVFGPYWENKYEQWENGVKCRISARIDGEWISKEDGAELTQFESVKGGFSSAMKRAAVQWGIGRYLYDLPEVWVDLQSKGEHYCKVKDQNQDLSLYWDTPDYQTLMNRQKSSSNQQQTKQPSGKQSQSKKIQEKQPSNHDTQKPNQTKNGKLEVKEALDSVRRCEMAIGFDLKYRPALFKRANNGNYVDLEKATIKELQNYYRVLRPVENIVRAGQYYGHDLETTLAYAQVCFQHRIDSIENLFIKTDNAKAKEVLQVLKEHSDYAMETA